jgi:hypothetical protein
LAKKETKKPRKKECSAFFPGQRTKILAVWTMSTGIDVIIQDPAAYFQTTQKALLFRLVYYKVKRFIEREKEVPETFFKVGDS